MSTELAIQNDLGMSLAEAIGVSNTGGETRVYHYHVLT